MGWANSAAQYGAGLLWIFGVLSHRLLPGRVVSCMHDQRKYPLLSAASGALAHCWPGRAGAGCECEARCAIKPFRAHGFVDPLPLRQRQAMPAVWRQTDSHTPAAAGSALEHGGARNAVSL